MKIQLIGLTGVRFFAALLIVFYHFAPPRLIGSSDSFRQFIGSGYIAVGLFFMLSGFVLTYSNLGMGSVAVSRVPFWKARFARVYPVYLLAFLLVFPLYFNFGRHNGFTSHWFTVVLTQLSLTQAWSPNTALEYNDPGWSLSAEAFFYLSFPFLAVRLSRLSTRHLYAAISIIWILGMAAAVHYTIAAHDLANHGLDIKQVHPRWLLAIKTNPLARLSEFTLGICLGLLYDRGLRLGRPFVVIGFISIAALGCVSDQIPTALLWNGILDPLFALLILGLSAYAGPVLSLPFVILLGEASYGLYILHHPLRRWFVILNHYTLRAAEDTIAFFLVYLGFIVLASLIVVPLVEKPMRRIILNRKLQTSPSVAKRFSATA